MTAQEGLFLLVLGQLLVILLIVICKVIRYFLQKHKVDKILKFMQDNINNKNKKDINIFINKIKNKEEFKNG
jgi:phage gp36-like protein